MQDRTAQISLTNKGGSHFMTKSKSISVRQSFSAYKETAPSTCTTYLNAMQIHTHAVGGTVP